MKKFFTLWMILLPCSAEEVLHYSINWPSSLSLGEARLESRPFSSGKDAMAHYEFNFLLDAAVPGFTVSDQFKSIASRQHCSSEFEKQMQHGQKKTSEVVTFQPEAGIAVRQSTGGGKSNIKVGTCAKDALTYLQWLRTELAQGRIPPPQTIIFGAAYRLTLKFGSTLDLPLANKRIKADRFEVNLKGPASENNFEVFFDREPDRKLVLVKVPLVIGSFSMELTD